MLRQRWHHRAPGTPRVPTSPVLVICTASPAASPREHLACSHARCRCHPGGLSRWHGQCAGLQASRGPTPGTYRSARRPEKQTRLPSRTVSGTVQPSCPARESVLQPDPVDLQNDASLATVCSPESHHRGSSPGPQRPVTQTQERRSQHCWLWKRLNLPAEWASGLAALAEYCRDAGLATTLAILQHPP